MKFIFLTPNTVVERKSQSKQNIFNKILEVLHVAQRTEVFRKGLNF